MRMFTARDRLKLLAGGGAAAMLTGCGGGGGGSSSTPPVSVTPSPPPPTPTPPTNTTFAPEVGQFKNTFEGNFQIGAAIQDNQTPDDAADSQILKDQFNSISAEFQMKPEVIAPREGEYDWTAPDALVQFAEDNGMAVRGAFLLGMS